MLAEGGGNGEAHWRVAGEEWAPAADSDDGGVDEAAFELANPAASTARPDVVASGDRSGGGGGGEEGDDARAVGSLGAIGGKRKMGE